MRKEIIYSANGNQCYAIRDRYGNVRAFNYEYQADAFIKEYHSLKASIHNDKPEPVTTISQDIEINFDLAIYNQ